MPETMPKSVNHIAFPIASTAAAHEFYTKVLGCKLVGAVRENRIPSTGEDIGFLHSFYAMSNGVAIAFFEIEGFDGSFDGNAPKFARHLAMNVDSMDELLDYKQRLEDAGVDVLGVTDHEGIWESIYFFDPNGIRLELTYQVRPLGEQDAADAEIAVQKWIAEHAGREQESGRASA
jgi:catechol 2,3-dioxygenase-like lactoylglutathione lyase family enzyme